MKVKNFKIEYLIYLFLLLTPFLDSISFLYREYGPDTLLSPTTILRPVIPVILLVYIYIKDRNARKYLWLGGFIYGLYALGHLWTFQHFHTDFNAGGVFSELQYVINYSYMIGLFYVLWWFHKQNRIPHLRKYIVWMLVAYLGLIYLAIFTNTSSTTYIDGVGYKGWNASGNGLSALLILGFCSIFTLLLSYKKKWYMWLFIVALFFYLITLFGTRTALFGGIIVVLIYFISYMIHYWITQKQISFKKIFLFGITVFVLTFLVLIGGSTAMKRRSNLKEVGSGMIDPLTNEVTHLTGDLTNFVVDIKKEQLDITLSEEQKNALLKTYQKANAIELSNSNRRMQQLIYHHYLFQEELSLSTFLFGTGYLNQYPELTLEMEIPAYFYNFGILGTILYLGPFIVIFVQGVILFFKRRMQVSIDYMMFLAGILFSFVLSCLTGYVYFYVSSMLVVLLLFILFLKEKEVANT